MLLVLQGTLVLLGAAVAQNPTSVDIDLVEGSTPGTLEVRVRPNGQGFSGIVSAVQFTISWPATSPATLGTRVRVLGGSNVIEGRAFGVTDDGALRLETASGPVDVSFGDLG